MSCKNNRDEVVRRVLIEGHPSVDIHELVGGDHVKVDKTKRLPHTQWAARC